MKKILIVLSILIIAVQAQANYKVNNPNTRDYMRLQRLTACENAYNESGLKLHYVDGKAPVVACSILMHSIYIWESATGQSNLCKTRNNCLGIKHTVNGYYGHNRFESQQEEMNMFAEKYFKYHYTKTVRTLIYGYKQPNGGWRYGWATLNKEAYVRFIQGIVNNYGLIQEYEYLYFANNQ